MKGYSHKNKMKEGTHGEHGVRSMSENYDMGGMGKGSRPANQEMPEYSAGHKGQQRSGRTRSARNPLLKDNDHMDPGSYDMQGIQYKDVDYEYGYTCEGVHPLHGGFYTRKPDNGQA